MMAGLVLLAWVVTAGGLAGAFYGLLSAWLAVYVAGGALALIAVLFLVNFLLMLAGKRPSWFSLLFGLPAAAAAGFYGYQRFKVPISDVTTDLANPPRFTHPVYPFMVEKGSAYLSPSLQVPRDYEESLAPTQIRIAPDLGNVKAKAQVSDAFTAAMKFFEQKMPDWRLLENDAGKFHAEFTFTLTPLNLPVDLALEARTDSKPPDSMIVLRCRSRIALADFGTCLSTVQDLRERLSLAMKALEDELAHKPAPPPEAKATATSTGTLSSSGTATDTTTTVTPPSVAPPPAEPAKKPNAVKSVITNAGAKKAMEDAE